MLTAACHILRPAYLHKTITVTPSTSDTEIVTVKQSPPFYFPLRPVLAARFSAVLECPPRLAARPAGTRGALLARFPAIAGQRPARAPVSGPASAPVGPHGYHLLTGVLRPPLPAGCRAQNAGPPGTLGTRGTGVYVSLRAVPVHSSDLWDGPAVCVSFLPLPPVAGLSVAVVPLRPGPRRIESGTGRGFR